MAQGTWRYRWVNGCNTLPRPPTNEVEVAYGSYAVALEAQAAVVNRESSNQARTVLVTVYLLSGTKDRHHANNIFTACGSPTRCSNRVAWVESELGGYRRDMCLTKRRGHVLCLAQPDPNKTPKRVPQHVLPRSDEFLKLEKLAVLLEPSAWLMVRLL